jgi:hypothetical protein
MFSSSQPYHLTQWMTIWMMVPRRLSRFTEIPVVVSFEGMPYYEPSGTPLRVLAIRGTLKAECQNALVSTLMSFRTPSGSWMKP